MQIFMNSLGKFLAAGLFVLLAGCTAVPGSHISTSPGWFLDEDESAEQAEPLSDVVQVHAITTNVLKAEPQARDRKSVV